MVRSPRLKKEDISLKTWKFGDVTDYVAAYSSDLDVAIILAKEDKSILVDELELEDEAYTRLSWSRIQRRWKKCWYYTES